MRPSNDFKSGQSTLFLWSFLGLRVFRVGPDASANIDLPSEDF